MSSHKEIVINTIEELVQYASQQRSNASRFTLEEKSVSVEARTYQKYLGETGHGWSYSLSLILSDELGKQIDEIWTKKEPYRNANYKRNYGSLSLQGILKRLGKSDVAEDIAKRIKAAEAAEEIARAKRNRNYKRKQIREKAEELYRLLTSENLVEWDTSKDGKDISFFIRLDQLKSISDEE